MLALSYFSRLPVPHTRLAWSEQELARATRYFPCVGALVALTGAAVLWAAMQALPVAAAMVLSLTAMVLCTGAFHEDGLADTADGLGGGFDPPQALRIMKDSRIGTYGALALLLTTALKFTVLTPIATASWQSAAWVLLLVHTLSRASAVGVMLSLPYLRGDDAQARAKAVADGVAWPDAAVALGTALPLLATAVALGAITPATAVALLLGLTALVFVAVRYLRQRLGGYTGDSLGAVQQTGECLGLLLCSVWLLP